MGPLGGLYTAFNLFYSIILAARDHGHLNRAEKTFALSSFVFVGLSIGIYFIHVLSIPSGYKCRYLWKSLVRGLLAPVRPLLHYPVLLYSKGRVRRALTFSNEAHDRVERTRQEEIFEMTDDLESPDLYLTTHDLLRYEGGKQWGYDKRVGEISVEVRFQVHFVDDDTIGKLQTSDWGSRLFLQYKRRAPTSPPHIPRSQEIIEAILPNRGSVPQGPGQGQAREKGSSLRFIYKALECVKGSCLCTRLIRQAVGSVKGSCLCECEDLESGFQIPGTPVGPFPDTPKTEQDPAIPYEVTITWSWGICGTRQCKCRCGSCFRRNEENQNQQPRTCCKSWNLSSKVKRKWTLFQIHQYMLCLDVWGNHPKQGIWKTDEPKTSCSGDTSGRNSRSTDQLFRYCYRHDELVDAIDKGKRLTRIRNNATWYTVV